MRDSFHITCLNQEYQKRRERNPSYTFSALARDIEISRAALSEILSGRRNLSYKTCEKLFALFPWSQQKKKEFLYSAAKTTVIAGKMRIHPEFKRILSDKESVLFEPKKIEQEDFSLISQWYYTAILELTFTGKFKRSDSKIIASRLGLSKRTTQKAIDTLIEHGYLAEKDGVIYKTHKKLSLANTEKTTQSLIRHQEQILMKARVKLKNTPIEQRSNSSMAMAIDPKNLPRAKNEIRLFLHKMSELLESGNQQNVYQLNVNLFSLED